MNIFAKLSLFNCLVVSLILASLTDVVLSYLWISDPSWGEANPIVRSLWLSWGYAGVIGWKVLFTGLTIGVIIIIRKLGAYKRAIFTLVVVNLIQFYVIFLLIQFKVYLCRIL